jgi:hypothetical protein
MSIVSVIGVRAAVIVEHHGGLSVHRGVDLDAAWEHGIAALRPDTTTRKRGKKPRPGQAGATAG